MRTNHWITPVRQCPRKGSQTMNEPRDEAGRIFSWTSSAATRRGHVPGQTSWADTARHRLKAQQQLLQLRPTLIMTPDFCSRALLRPLSALGVMSRQGPSTYRTLWAVHRLASLVSVRCKEFSGPEFHTGRSGRRRLGVFLIKLVKADLGRVLAIIGVCQCLILPVIGAASRVRAVTAAAFAPDPTSRSRTPSRELRLRGKNSLDAWLESRARRPGRGLFRVF